MYKKLARIGPISFGIFFALLMVLLAIVIAVFGVFVLPLIPMGQNTPPITIFEPIMAMTTSTDGLLQLGMSLGFAFLAYFVIGLVLAILYNIVAAITGGVKVKVHDLGYDDI